MSDDTVVLLLPDLARVLRTSTRTIKRGLRAGTFPIQPLRGIDSRLRWSRKDVDMFLGVASEEVEDQQRMLAAVAAVSAKWDKECQ